MLTGKAAKARALSLLFVITVLVAVFSQPVDAQLTPRPLPTVQGPRVLPSTLVPSASGWLAFEGANAETPNSGAKWSANNQPLSDATARVCESSLPTKNVDTRSVKLNGNPLVPIGGDYWHMTHKSRPSFGHQGSCWFKTPVTAKDMRSIVFPLQTHVAVRARGEGKIEVRAEDDSVIGTANVVIQVAPLSAGLVTPTMTELVIDTTKASGKKGRVVVIPAAPGKTIEIDDVRVYSGPPKNPSFARDIGVGGRAWGFADLHVHLATHQAMGGLQGVRTMWGVPGGSFKDYAQNPKLINQDIPRCNGFNHWVGKKGGPEGFLGSGLINGMSGHIPEPEATVAMVHGIFHHEQGGNGFYRKQHNKDGFHQQHHITAIRRAYEGGLRLMGVLANHSEFMELLNGKVKVEAGREYIQLTDEMELARAHVCYVQQLADLNSDWMEVAYSADDAQRIISSNKLALIIGLELPDAGNLIRNVTAEQEVNELYSLGVRQITLIHGANNKLGGTQIFQDVYDWFNDLMWTGRDDRGRVFRNHEDAKRTAPVYIQPRVNEGGCNLKGQLYEGKRGECVLYNLGHIPLRPVVTRVNSILSNQGIPVLMTALYPVTQFALLSTSAAPLTPTFFPLIAPLVATVPVLYTVISTIPEMSTPTGLIAPAVDLPGVLAGIAARGNTAVKEGRGELNSAGLTSRGEEYVRAMMSRGMMIDLAHASDKSTQRVFELSRSYAGGNGCNVTLGTFNDVKRIAEDKSAANTACFANAYPLVISHSQIRAQSIQKMIPGDDKSVEAFLRSPNHGLATTNKAWAPREFEISNSQLEWFERIGGVVGIFLGQDGIIDPPGNQRAIRVPNDCANTTNAFAWAYAYANQMLNGHGAALSSDATYHDMNGPRFGAQACMTDLYPPNSIEARLNPQFFQPSRQRNAVRYSPLMSQAALARADQPPLIPYKQDQIMWDYNVEGWANYGVIPDMLQDAKNLGLDEENMSAMFRSAQDYVDAWAKATRVSRCDEAGGKCIDAEVKRQPNCGDKCKGTCPNDAHAGSPGDAELTTPACGRDGQRACCFGETGYPCVAGLQEVQGCNLGGAACTCSSGVKASSMCRPTSPCGGLNERACCALEADFGQCKANLLAVPGCTMGEAKCKCGKGSLLMSAHHCEPAAQPCGGPGQRACCSLETGYACKPGAKEVPGCTYGNVACRCGKGSTALASSHCEAAAPPPPPAPDTPCGDVNQRACCLGETGFACKNGAVEKPGCGFGAAACKCGKGSTVQASSHCEAPPTPPPAGACGGRGQRACCLGETGYACKPGTREVGGCSYGAAACKCGKGSAFSASSHCE